MTISADSYRSLFLDHRSGVLLEAIRHGATDAIRYRPAWLRQVIQSHLRIHGEELYQAAKSSAVAIENALSLAGRMTGVRPPDPVREMAGAASLLRSSKRSAQTRCSPSADAQRELF